MKCKKECYEMDITYQTKDIFKILILADKPLYNWINNDLINKLRKPIGKAGEFWKKNIKKKVIN